MKVDVKEWEGKRNRDGENVCNFMLLSIFLAFHSRNARIILLPPFFSQTFCLCSMLKSRTVLFLWYTRRRTPPAFLLLLIPIAATSVINIFGGTETVTLFYKSKNSRREAITFPFRNNKTVLIAVFNAKRFRIPRDPHFGGKGLIATLLSSVGIIIVYEFLSWTNWFPWNVLFPLKIYLWLPVKNCLVSKVSKFQSVILLSLSLSRLLGQ